MEKSTEKTFDNYILEKKFKFIFYWVLVNLILLER